MNTVIYIQKLCAFISNQFPLLALISLLTITIILVFREKRRRKLTLLIPKENEQIDELLKNKAINEKEAEKLKKAANALPEVVEEYPLPDIHLRLTAALAKTYSLLKVLLLIANAYIFYIIWQIPASVNATKTFKAENAWLLIIMYSLFILLSIAQFTASIYLTRGGSKSRMIIAFIWLLDLALLPMALSGVNSIFYSIVAITACGYSLWVLYLRRNAGTYIDFKAKTPNKIMKMVVALIFLLCLSCGVFFVSSKIKYKYIATSTKTTSKASICSSSSNNCSTLNKVAIIASSPDKETTELALSIFNTLQKKFPKLNFKYLKFGKSFPKNEIKFDQFVFISKIKIIKQKAAKSHALPPAILRKFKIPQTQYVIEPAKSISFNVVLGGRFGFYNPNGNGPNLNFTSGNSIGGSILVTGDISNCLEKIAIKKCAEEIVKHLAKEYRKAENLYTHLNIPDFLAPRFKKISFENIKFLKGAWCIGNFRSVNFNNHSIYLFPLKKDRKKQKEAIIEELKKTGWNYLVKDSYNNNMFFSKTKNYLSIPQIIVYLPPLPDVNSKIFSEAQFRKYFGRFIYASGNKHRFSAKEADKLKEFDFKSYLQCIILYNLTEAEAIDTFERVYNDKNASFNILKTLYEKTNDQTLKTLYEKNKDERFLKGLVIKREKLLIKMGNILKTQMKKPNSPKQILELATLIKKENKYPLEKHPAFIHFQDRIVKVKLNYEPKLKRYIADKINISAKKSPVIIQLNNIGKYKKSYLSVISRKKLKDKNTKIIIIVDSMCHIYQGKDNMIETSISRNTSGIWSMTSSQAPRYVLNNLRPEEFGLYCNYWPKKDVFEFNAIFKEK